MSTARPLSLEGQPTRTTLATAASFGPIFTDSSGAVYLRFFPREGDTFLSPVTRISKSGQTTEINISKIPEIKGDSDVLTFAIGPEGRIYSIVGQAGVNLFKTASPSLAVFSQDGTLLSRSALELGFIPTTLVPLSTGDVFIGGEVPAPTKTAPNATRQFLGLFSTDGKLRREVAFDSTSTYEPKKMDGIIPSEFPFGYTRLGNDGNVYILDTDGPRVQVFSAAGELVRRFKLDRPDAKANASGLFVSGNRILILYWWKTDKPDVHEYAFVVYDAEEGTTVATYTPDFRGIPVGWENGKTLTVLVPDKGFIALAKATLQ